MPPSHAPFHAPFHAPSHAPLSPEYPGPTGPDANYDVSLYRWGLATGIELAAQYGLTSPHLQSWKDTLAEITWFSVDPKVLLY
jgi:hypothetical protein